MADVKLSNEITEILTRSSIDGNLLTLPEGQLDRKLYQQVAKVIEFAGGKWNTGKKGFVFQSDPRPKLGLTLSSGVAVDEKKLKQAFYTPADIARDIAVHADVAGKRVLEPSAGGGALVRACLDLGAAKVSAIEKDSECSEALHALLHDRRGDNSLQICDFLDVTPRRAYDRVVMNPPFTRGQDLKHVKHALQFLAHGGALFSVVPDKDCPKFEALGAETVARFEPGAFKSSGTNVATKLIRILRESA